MIRWRDAARRAIMVESAYRLGRRAVAADQDTPGTRLALLMRRRGWSAARLAEVAGAVSATSIRAYAADRSVPRPSQALAIATALGPVDGQALLEAWGLHDLAHAFYQKWREENVATDESIRRRASLLYGPNRIEYPGEPVSEAGRQLAQAVLAWVQHLEGSADDLARAGQPPAAAPSASQPR
jgi:transcriptional regulator with XRE-family HTH domain